MKYTAMGLVFIVSLNSVYSSDSSNTPPKQNSPIEEGSVAAPPAAPTLTHQRVVSPRRHAPPSILVQPDLRLCWYVYSNESDTPPSLLMSGDAVFWAGQTVNLILNPFPNTVPPDRLIELHKTGQLACFPSYWYPSQQMLQPGNALTPASEPLGDPSALAYPPYSLQLQERTNIAASASAPAVSTQKRSTDTLVTDYTPSLPSASPPSTPTSSLEAQKASSSADSVRRSPSDSDDSTIESRSTSNTPRVYAQDPADIAQLPRNPRYSGDATPDSSESSVEKDSNASDRRHFSPLPDPAQELSESERLRDRNQELSDIVEQQEKRIDELITERDGLVTDVSNLQVKNVEQAQTISAQQKEIEKLKKQSAEKDRKIAELQAKLQQVEEQH